MMRKLSVVEKLTTTPSKPSSSSSSHSMHSMAMMATAVAAPTSTSKSIVVAPLPNTDVAAAPAGTVRSAAAAATMADPFLTTMPPRVRAFAALGRSATPLTR